MPSPEMRRRISSLGLFVLPIVVVKAASVAIGSSAHVPASAVASASQTSESPAESSTSLRLRWNDSQTAAADHVRSLSSQSFGPCPMLYTQRQQPTAAVETEPEPVVVEQPIPEFVLRGVMTASTGDKAFINNGQYLVGEKISETGWRVRSINVATRSVVVEEVEGERTVTLLVEIGG